MAVDQINYYNHIDITVLLMQAASICRKGRGTCQAPLSWLKSNFKLECLIPLLGCMLAAGCQRVKYRDVHLETAQATVFISLIILLHL